MDEIKGKERSKIGDVMDGDWYVTWWHFKMWTYRAYNRKTEEIVECSSPDRTTAKVRMRSVLKSKTGRETDKF